MSARGERVWVIDQGTTSTRVLVFDRDGAIVTLAREPVPVRHPHPGWSEVDAEALWQGVTRALERALEADPGGRPAALAVANQRETTILWSRRDGRPLAPAVVWSCRRTAALARRHKRQGHEPFVRARTGLRIDPYFSATKIAWLLEQDPALGERARAGEVAFGTVDSYLLWQLTAGVVHATDETNASRTLLWNLDGAAFDPALLELFGLPAAILPECHPSGHAFGRVATPPALEGVPVLALAGDQQASLCGHGLAGPDAAKLTLGTGAFLLAPAPPGAGTAPGGGLLRTAACRADGEASAHALEGSLLDAGAALEWAGRLGLGPPERILDGLDPEDGTAPADGVVFVPALSGRGAPRWEPEAGAAFVGMSQATTGPDLARAVALGLVMAVADLVEAANAAGLPLRTIHVDGGLSRSAALCQSLADAAAVEIVQFPHAEATALGAAFLAGRGLGLWRQVSDLALSRGERRVFAPRPERLAWARAAYRAAVEAAVGYSRRGGPIETEEE